MNTQDEDIEEEKKLFLSLLMKRVNQVEKIRPIFTYEEIAQKLKILTDVRSYLLIDNLPPHRRKELELEFSKASGFFVFHGISLTLKDGKYKIKDPEFRFRIIPEVDDFLVRKARDLCRELMRVTTEREKEIKEREIFLLNEILKRKGYKTDIQGNEFCIVVERIEFNPQ